MSTQGWANDPVRAAAGRAHYNAVRQVKADLRRVEVGRLLRRYGLRYGTGRTTAAELGVSESTVPRDIRTIFRRVPPPGTVS